VVADLSALPHRRKVEMIERGLGQIRRLRGRLGLPHWVILDEAHYSLHRGGIEEEALGIDDKGFCLVTYKPSWIRESALKEIDIFILACTRVPEERAFLRAFLSGPGRAGEVISLLPDLPRGEFLLIQPGETGDRTAATFVATPRETRHVRHLTKYADFTLPPERRFFFRRPDGRFVAAVGSLNDFRKAVLAVEEYVLAHHASRGDFSRWILEVFNDRELGVQLRKIETRWSRGETPDLRLAIGRLIADRYGAER
jgi:hypothetical protein